MIPKSGNRFTEKTMLKQQAKAKYESTKNHFALGHDRLDQDRR
jgi:hypothetical protein